MKPAKLALPSRNGWIWISVLAAFLLLYFIFDPLESRWMPQCLFHKFTGLQCMGCGSQRVVHHLLHGEVREAFMANALLVCSLPFIIFLVWVEVFREKYPRLYARVHSRSLIITVGVVLALWLILRNLLGC